MRKLIISVILAGLILTAVPVTAEESGTVSEICIQYTTRGAEQRDIPEVEAAINAVSEPAIGVRIRIVPVFIGNLAADTAYAIASGEKIDIVNVGLTHDMTTMVSDGLLLPLDDLLEEYGQEAARVTAPVAQAEKIGGITYAISQYPYAANCSGFYYNKEMAEEFGIDMHDDMTLEELEAAAAVLKEHGVYLTSVGLTSELTYKFFCCMETFGESGNYGVILDPAENTQIVNLYASEQLREFFRTIRRWYEEGYLPENQMLDEVAVRQLYEEGLLFCMPTNVTAKQKGTGGNRSYDTDIVRTSDVVISTSGAVEFMLGLASTCKDPEAAMKFINLIYTNPEVANLLNYGIEGLDYTAVEGTQHVITVEGTPNADGSGYGSGFVQFGNPLDLKIRYPLTDHYYEELVEWEESASMSLSFGYSFDAGEFSVEAISIARILEEYLPILNVGMAEDVDAQLDAMNAELEAAGINEIIAVNNERLQEYLAGLNHPPSDSSKITN